MLYVKMCVKITFGWYSRFFVVFGCIGVVLIVFAWFYVSLCVFVWFSLIIPVLVGFIWFHGYLSDFQGFWLPVCFWKAKGRKQDIKKKP